MKRDCTQPGCPNKAVAHGFCHTHLYRRKKGLPMDAPIKPRSLHPRRCSMEDCERRAESQGMCNPHYQRTLRCKREGCGRRAHRWKLCSYHGREYARGTPLEAPPRQLQPRRGLCAVPMCHRPIRAAGLCTTHYLRKRRGMENWDAPLHARGRNGSTLTWYAGLRLKHSTAAMLESLRPEWVDAKDYTRLILAAWARRAYRQELATLPARLSKRALVSMGLPAPLPNRTPLPAPEERRCSVAGCKRPKHSSGLCSGHYSRKRLGREDWGKPLNYHTPMVGRVPYARVWLPADVVGMLEYRRPNTLPPAQFVESVLLANAPLVSREELAQGLVTLEGAV